MKLEKNVVVVTSRTKTLAIVAIEYFLGVENPLQYNISNLIYFPLTIKHII